MPIPIERLEDVRAPSRAIEKRVPLMLERIEFSAIGDRLEVDVVVFDVSDWASRCGLRFGSEHGGF